MRTDLADTSTLATDLQTGLLAPDQLCERVERELHRSHRGCRPGCLAVIDVEELATVRERFGAWSTDVLARQLATLVLAGVGPFDEAGRDRSGRFVVMMPETTADECHRQLTRLAERVVDTTFSVGPNSVRLTPIIGYAEFGTATEAHGLLHQAVRAAEEAELFLDLRPVAFRPELLSPPRPSARTRPWRDRLRTPLQLAAAVLLGLVLPFVGYLAADAAGFGVVVAVAALVVVGILVLTAVCCWAEGFLARTLTPPPDEPGSPEPPASAIITAYLPNEAATLMETVESFLAVDYPAPLQIIVAYNTPRPMPIEDTLTELAHRDPRLLPLRVAYSTSKAQNITAALSEVTGEFVGVFDADHLPAPDSFRRAWRWLSNGWDVTRGHSVVRNGDASLAARMVAVKSETVHAVSYPRGTRLHGFGIGYVSNGYWRTDLLRSIWRRGSVVTEDPERTGSCIRVVAQGGRIASDPGLVFSTLAPTTWGALWNQHRQWFASYLGASLLCRAGRLMDQRPVTVSVGSGTVRAHLRPRHLGVRPD